MSVLEPNTWPVACSMYVVGTPVAQPRPKARAFAGHAQVYTPKTADGWKLLIRAAAARQRPEHVLTGPLAVDLDFYLPRPQRLMRRRDPSGPIPHPARPDIDNLAKAVYDAIGDTHLWWKDDSQICDGRLRKQYAAKDGQTGVHVTVRAAELVRDQMALCGEEVGSG